jgi:hypothetical protein
MALPEADSNPAASAEMHAVDVSTRRGAGVWVAALAACLIASTLSWLATEAVVRSIPTEIEEVDVNGEAKGIVTTASANRSDVKRAVMAHGFRGAALATALGLAGGLARRRVAIVAGVVGLVFGCAAGVGAAFGVFNAYFRYLDPISGDLLLPLISHAAVWGALGAAGGLAFGLGLREGPGCAARTALGGLIGAVLGAAVFQLAGGFAFPRAKTDMPLAAEAVARLTAEVLCGLSVAAGVAVAYAGAFAAAKRIGDSEARSQAIP